MNAATHLRTALSSLAAQEASFEAVLVVLGQRSLGAFVLHVYGLLLLAHLRLPDSIWINTLAQVTLVCAIAAVLSGMQRLRYRRRRTEPEQARPLAA